MKDSDDIQDLTPEEKLKAENELLKLKLQAEFGMKDLDSTLNEGAENEWLNHIYEFEKQFAEGKRCTVYDFIGRPKYRNADELTKEEISRELEIIGSIMKSNGMQLDTICNYEDEVIYRFITEELFEHETDDMRVPGMTCYFIYEEFHPNHDYDIRKLGTEFVEFLISKKWDEFMNDIMLASMVSYNDKKYNKKKIPAIIKAFQSEHKKMKLLKWEIHSVNFDLEKETGSIDGSIKYKSAASSQVFQGRVSLEIKLKYDFWSISKIVIPGFSK